MNKFISLCRVTLSDVFFTSGSSNKKKRKLSGGMSLTIILMAVVMVMLGVSAYSTGNMLEHDSYTYLISLGMAYSAMMVLVLGVFKVPTFLFAFKDYDLLMSLPVPSSQVMASKLIPLYVSNFIYSTAFSLGYFVACGLLLGADAQFYIMSVISMLFIPFFPLVIGSLIGLLLGWISKKSGNNTAVKIITSVLAMVCLMAFSFTIGFSQSMDSATTNAIYSVVDKINFPVLILKDAIINQNWLIFAAFAVGEVLLFVVFSLIFAKSFKNISSGMHEHSKRKNAKEEKIVAGSVFGALFRKEITGYVNNTNYFLNTFVGYIIILIGAVVLLFVDTSAFLAEVGISPLLLLMAAMTFFSVLSPITTPSISLEAHNLWIYRSSPIDAKKLIQAKLAMALTMALPVGIICSVLLGIGLKMNAVQIVMFCVYSVSISLLAQIGGMGIGLAMPKLDWTNEITVIKQSSAVTLSVLGGMGLAFVIGAGYIVLAALGANEIIVSGVASAVMLGITAGLYAIIMTAGARKFDRLEI